MEQTPYPGLRPFKEEEALFFFGQDTPLADLRKRLYEQRFVAILGFSGCGKSSLLRAGLLADIRPKRIEGARARWLVGYMRPGHDPLQNLIETVAGVEEEILVQNKQSEPPTTERAFDVRTGLRADGYGLARFGHDAGLVPDQRVLIVVDQFEELFRFQREAPTHQDKDGAALFVRLLIEAVRDQNCRVSVVITMRSEFLGDCSLFFGLAELVNEGTFLLPRVSRSQIEEVITGPAEECGFSVNAEVVQEMLNETEEQDDGLPLLQHALRRVWERPRHSLTAISVEDFHSFDTPAVDGVLKIKHHLDDHLDSIYKSLGENKKDVTKLLFRLLSKHDPSGRLTRRPVAFSDIVAAIGENRLEDIKAVIEAFRDENNGRTFLTPPTPELFENSFVDVSHECLLRRWDRLGKWIELEELDAEQFQRLASDADQADLAAIHAKKPRQPLAGPNLDRYTQWWKDATLISAEWALRYQGELDPILKRPVRSFAAAKEYLEWSRWKSAKRTQRARFLGAATVSVVLLCISLGAYVWIRGKQAALQTLREKAQTQSQLRESAEKKADGDRIANERLKIAYEQLSDARRQVDINNKQLQSANAELTKQKDSLRQELYFADLARTKEQEAEVQVRQKETEVSNANATLAKQNAERIETAHQDIDRQLQAAVAQPLEWDRRNAISNLQTLSRLTKEHSGLPGQSVIQTLGRLFVLTLLRDNDKGQGSPVIQAFPGKGGLGIQAITLGKTFQIPHNGGEGVFHNAAANPVHSGYAAKGGTGGWLFFEYESEVPWKRHFFPITGLGYSTDGEWIASASASSDLRLVRSSSISTPPGTDSLTFWENVKNISSLSVNTAKLIGDLFIYRYKGDYSVREFAISLPPDAMTAKRFIERKDVTVYGLTEGGQFVIWKNPGPIGTQIRSVNGKHPGKQWVQLTHLYNGNAAAIATEPASQDVWLGYSDGKLADLTKDKYCPELKESHGISAVAWDAGSNKLAIGLSTGDVHVYQRTSRKDECDLAFLMEIRAHSASITSLLWQGDQLITGSSDGSARSWDLNLSDRQLAILHLVAKGTGMLSESERQSLTEQLISKIEALVGPEEPSGQERPK